MSKLYVLIPLAFYLVLQMQAVSSTTEVSNSNDPSDTLSEIEGLAKDFTATLDTKSPSADGPSTIVSSTSSDDASSPSSGPRKFSFSDLTNFAKEFAASATVGDGSAESPSGGSGAANGPSSSSSKGGSSAESPSGGSGAANGPSSSSSKGGSGGASSPSSSSDDDDVSAKFSFSNLIPNP